jgi:biopolymer transport protein ExbB
MKNAFSTIVILLEIVIGFLIWSVIMGNPDNFMDPATKHEPSNTLGMIYTGGPLVSLLIAFIIMAVTFIIERALSIARAKGKSNPAKFIKDVIASLTKGDLDGAVALCDKQKGSVANVLRSAIVRFQEVENDPEFPGEKKVAEVQRAIDEAMNLETPLLEKNLVILSTIASVSVLVGLLGTTVGMIRAFRALALSGTVSATQLSIGISEALYNTAGGLIGAILAIVGYNFFTTKVDNFVYMIDEAILNITQIFTVRIKK